MQLIWVAVMEKEFNLETLSIIEATTQERSSLRFTNISSLFGGVDIK